MNDSTQIAKSPESIQRAAEQGELKAQYELGMMYEHGISMPKDYQAAIFWYRTAADLGSDCAQFKLAVMYESGHGVTQDYSKAALWLRKAADSGLSEAQYRLGFLLEKGLGIPAPKYAEAATWYWLSSKQGCIDASYRLGLLNEMGLGMPIDLVTAAQHYAIAAQHGNANAQYSLGVMYVTGDGVTKDLAQATQLLEAAAAHGHKRARRKYDETIDTISNTPKPPAAETVVQKRRRITEEEKENSLAKQLLQIVKKAAGPALPSMAIFLIVRFTPIGQWLIDYADQYRSAMIALAVVCVIVLLILVPSFFKIKTQPNWFKVGCAGIIATIALGLGFLLMKPTAKSPETIVKPGSEPTAPTASAPKAAAAAKARAKALAAAVAPSIARQEVENANAQLLKKASKGDVPSQVRLALRYEFGTGFEKSPQRAAGCYAAAAKSNDKFAQCRLGMMYKDGEGVKSDPKLALKWLQQSANQDFAPADYQLGLMYEFGQGVKTNFKSAANWYQQGDRLQERHNQYRLGLLVLSGDGVKQDPTRGLQLIESAATKGLPRAAAKMAAIYKFGRGVDPSDEIAARWQMQAKKLEIVLPGTEEWLYQQADEAIKVQNQTLTTPKVKS